MNASDHVLQPVVVGLDCTLLALIQLSVISSSKKYDTQPSCCMPWSPQVSPPEEVVNILCVWFVDLSFMVTVQRDALLNVICMVACTVSETEYQACHSRHANCHRYNCLYRIVISHSFDLVICLMTVLKNSIGVMFVSKSYKAACYMMIIIVANFIMKVKQIWQLSWQQLHVSCTTPLTTTIGLWASRSETFFVVLFYWYFDFILNGMTMKCCISLLADECEACIQSHVWKKTV